jgi:hypothetical protein
MTTPAWIAFAAAMPDGDSPILAVSFSTGDLWESFPQDVVDAVNAANGHVGEPAPYAHVEVLSVGGNDFGVRLYRGEGRGEELSEAEYRLLHQTGYWMNLTDFLRAERPVDHPFIVNGAAESESLVA